MLAFSCSLVFAQQGHPPLKKNMEYLKCLVPIMPGGRSQASLLIRREQLKDDYITTHKNKLTSTQKDSQVSIFVVVMANTMLF